MNPTPPRIVILAGPNGAGKSTSAPRILRDALGVDEFVNADVIAQGLSGLHPERVAMEAGRIMLKRIKALAAARRSFAFETTLSTRSFAPWLAGLEEGGYHLHLNYVWVPAPELSIARVAERVRQGGHHVPPDIIRRRYRKSLDNFFHLYRPLATHWVFYDNSRNRDLRPVAIGSGRTTREILDPDTWNRVMPQQPAAREEPARYRTEFDREVEAITRAGNEAIHEALWQHCHAGNPVAVWENEQVVWIQPDELREFLENNPLPPKP
ncbi:zeta toxin family protein [Endothiovibrio diazotrophicus]